MFILAAPSINPMQLVNYVEYGKGVRLQCTISGYPLPSVTWKKDGDLLRLSHTVRNATTKAQILSEVEIKKTDLLDIGSYLCIAENMFGRRFINTTLQVISEHEYIYRFSFSTSSVDNLVRSKSVSVLNRVCIAWDILQERVYKYANLRDL